MEPRSGARTPRPIEALLLDQTPSSDDDGKPLFCATSATMLVQATRGKVAGNNAYQRRGDKLESPGTSQPYNLIEGAWKMQRTTDVPRHNSRTPIHRRYRRRIARLHIIRAKDPALGLDSLFGTRYEQHNSYRQSSNQHPVRRAWKKSDCCNPSWSTNYFSTSIPLLKCVPWSTLVPTPARSSNHSLQTELGADEELLSSSLSGHRIVEAQDQKCSRVGECSGAYRGRPNDQEDHADSPVTCAGHNHAKSKRTVSRDKTREERDQWHENGDGDDQKPKKRRRPPGDGDDGYSKRYACPFYKQNPPKYRNSTCVGPGWISVSRVKFVRLPSCHPPYQPTQIES
jgi:hypothetical protein